MKKYAIIMITALLLTIPTSCGVREKIREHINLKKIERAEREKRNIVTNHIIDTSTVSIDKRYNGMVYDDNKDIEIIRPTMLNNSNGAIEITANWVIDSSLLYKDNIDTLRFVDASNGNVSLSIYSKDKKMYAHVKAKNTDSVLAFEKITIKSNKSLKTSDSHIVANQKNHIDNKFIDSSTQLEMDIKTIDKVIRKREHQQEGIPSWVWYVAIGFITIAISLFLIIKYTLKSNFPFFLYGKKSQ